MWVIAGLGNPGREYERTRHNAGWWVLDELARQFRSDVWSEKSGSLITRCPLSNDEVMLVKPLGYMNRSGEFLSRVLKFYKLCLADLIVIHDDLDLEPGSVRIKFGGGAGGHKGIADIIRHLGSDFTRVRLGIGHPRLLGGEARQSAIADVSSWVLGRPPQKEYERLDVAIGIAAQAATDCLVEGVASAQRKFNIRGNQEASSCNRSGPR